MTKPEETKPEASDYLMWVGSIYYTTVDNYIDEGKVQGCCKRLGHLPNGLVPGKSKIFLAHDDGINGEGFIFGYFIPAAFQYLAEDEADVPYTLVDRVQWISDWSNEEERGCGDRREGLYTISGTGSSKDTLPEEDSVAGEFVIFDKPRILNAFDPGRTHFRGMLAIQYGKKVINAKKNQTMIPPSRIVYPDRIVTDEELVERMDNGDSLSRVAQQIAYETKSTRTAVMYRYNVLAGKVILSGKVSPEEQAAKKLAAKVLRQEATEASRAEAKRAKILTKNNPDGKLPKSKFNFGGSNG